MNERNGDETPSKMMQMAESGILQSIHEQPGQEDVFDDKPVSLSMGMQGKQQPMSREIERARERA